MLPNDVTKKSGNISKFSSEVESTELTVSERNAEKKVLTRLVNSRLISGPYASIELNETLVNIAKQS